MTRDEILAFLRQHKLAVQATTASAGSPQAAVVGVAFTDELGVVFDTLDTSRKIANLKINNRIAFVVGWEDRTVQWEGTAEILATSGTPEIEKLKALYLSVYPDGVERLKWPGLVYVHAKPTWLRYSDFRREPPEIVELKLD